LKIQDKPKKCQPNVHGAALNNMIKSFIKNNFMINITGNIMKPGCWGASFDLGSCSKLQRRKAIEGLLAKSMPK
jgi:hypothetical protein